jgi:hypothetical protein
MTPATAVEIVAGQTVTTPASTPGWLLPVIGVAGLVASWRLLPPTSRASRAAWVMIGIGASVAIGLQWVDHRALLVLGLPIVAAASPAAFWRRTRASQADLSTVIAARRLNWSMVGVVLFLFGVTQAAVRPQSDWPLWFALAGAICVGGFAPVHRPVTELIRHAAADIRMPLILLLGPLTWAVLAKWFSHEAAARFGSHSTLLLAGPMLSLWLGALLILSRGDLGRLSAAAFLFAAGQSGIATTMSLSAGMEVITAQAAPLLLVTLLMAKLERMAGTHETAELGGLAHQVPWFAAALAVSWMWFCGVAGLAPLRPLWTAWIQQEVGRFSVTNIWPLLVPQVIAVWGAVRFLDDLLLGTPRAPMFPEPLRDRAPASPATQLLTDLTGGECAMLGVLAAIGIEAAI